MLAVTINCPDDKQFPFSRELWDDPYILYHGTWSVYSTRIDSEGFGQADLPLNHEQIATIMRARTLIGIGSYAGPVFFHDRPPKPPEELSLTGNFWYARAYATDGGGEIVRIMLGEARDFEDLCLRDDRRLALKKRWECGLAQSPGHEPTLQAVELLGNREVLQELCDQVKLARKGIEAVTQSGFPVVYAVHVEAHWFGDTWERYVYQWHLGRRAVELRCRRDLVTQDRIVAKAMYPSGADPNFLAPGTDTWEKVEALRQSPVRRV